MAVIFLDSGFLCVIQWQAILIKYAIFQSKM